MRAGAVKLGRVTPRHSQEPNTSNTRVLNILITESFRANSYILAHDDMRPYIYTHAWRTMISNQMGRR